MKGDRIMDTKKKVLVCVTQQKTCERLIKRGAHISDEISGELYVIHVVLNGWNFLGNSQEGEALEYLFGISKSVGADLTVLRADDIAKTIISFSKEYKISCIVLGEPPQGSKDNNIIQELRKKLYNTDIYIMPADEVE